MYSTYYSLLLVAIFLLSILEMVSIYQGFKHNLQSMLLYSIGLFLADFLILTIRNIIEFSLISKLLLICLIIVNLLNIVIQRKRHLIIGQKLNNNSIKESLEKLPFGICYFNERGLIKYCNSFMYQLVYEISGKDLQNKNEFESIQSLTNEDGLLSVKDKYYTLKENDVEINGYKFYQFVASDVSEIYLVKEKLKKSNDELNRMLVKINEVRNNLTEVIHQQELLSAKMRLHNKMGNCLLLIRQYLSADKDQAKRTLMIETWKDSLNSFFAEIDEENHPLAELVRIAKKVGIEVKINGVVPNDPKTSYLLMISLRECISNAARHGKATSLEMTIKEENNLLVTTFTNNGLVPKEAVNKGSGLSILEEKINAAGGLMSIRSFPSFVITIELPKDIMELD